VFSLGDVALAIHSSDADTVERHARRYVTKLSHERRRHR
jgi:hypothetical protein